MATRQQRMRRYVKSVLLKRNRYQFGQPKSKTVTDRYPGDVACADASIQMIVRLAKGRNVSLDYVRRKTRAPAGKPTPIANVVPGLRRLGLKYELVSGLDAKRLMIIARQRGPVLIAEDYWAHPQWKGYVYGGHTQNGFANDANGRRQRVGFARPLEESGNNQPTFIGGHMVLLATSEKRAGGNVGYVRDPNHNSPVRPERPEWDVVGVRQLNRMLRSFNRRANVVAFIPTEVIIKP